MVSGYIHASEPILALYEALYVAVQRICPSKWAADHFDAKTASHAVNDEHIGAVSIATSCGSRREFAHGSIG